MCFEDLLTPSLFLSQPSNDPQSCDKRCTPSLLSLTSSNGIVDRCGGKGLNQVHKVSVSLLLVMPFFDSTWTFDGFGRVNTELWHGQRITWVPKTCARKSSGTTGHAGIFRNSLENAQLNERRLHGLELIIASSSCIRFRLFLQTTNVPIACRSGPRWRHWAVARRDQCEIRLGRALPALAYSSEHLLCSMLWTTCNWITMGSVKLENPLMISFWCRELSHETSNGLFDYKKRFCKWEQKGAWEA